MTGLTYRRVLTGAALGAAAGWAAGCQLFPGTSFPLGLFRGPVYHVVPLGAILGVRFAVGKGGTARWTALLVSWGLWACMAWVMTPEGWEFPVLFHAVGMVALTGGWAAMVWRSMRKLAGEPPASTALSLAFAGILGGRLIYIVGLRVVDQFFSFPPFKFEPAGWGMLIMLNSLGLICGVGGIASLSGRMSLNWALLVSAAGLASLGAVGGLGVLHRHLHLESDWSFLPWVVIELAWFFYWGHRLAASAREEA